ncbi:MAG: hypothetical protein ABI772_12625, partial [Bacteroidota bacterium]
MARSFQIVEHKIAESDFFLDQLEKTTYDYYQLFQARCFISAFLSASRSITFCLQAAMNDIEGFKEWYVKQQENLKGNTLAKYFVNARNHSQKTGYYPVVYSQIDDDDNNKKIRWIFWDLEHPDVEYTPDGDIVEACK